MKIFKVSTKGRINIPAALRQKYGIVAGSKIAFLEKDGTIGLQPLNRNYFDSIAGVLGLKGKHLKSLMDGKEKERNV